MKRTITLIIALAIMFNFFGCGNNNSVSEITVDELAEKVKQNQPIYLLDVRTVREYEAGRLSFANDLIPYDSLSFYEEKLPANKDTAIYCFCRSGRRSGIATEYLKSIGYTNVHNVKGGIIAWQNAGYKIVSGQ